MAFKFWNIGEANAEIDRLAAEVAKLSGTKPDASAEHLAAVAKITHERDIAVAERDQSRAALASANDDRQKLIDGHAQAMKDLEASVESRAATRAVTIVASAGLPNPIGNKPVANATSQKQAIDPKLKGRDRTAEAIRRDQAAATLPA